MNPKTKGNIAVGKAINYFSQKAWYIFLPLSDNGGCIDLIVSKDGIDLKRIQCKYTERRHKEMLKKYPDRKIYDFRLTQLKEHYNHHSKNSTAMLYETDSFDFLFLTCPKGSYLIDWKKYCQRHGRAPRTIATGKRLKGFKIL